MIWPYTAHICFTNFSIVFADFHPLEVQRMGQLILEIYSKLLASSSCKSFANSTPLSGAIGSQTGERQQ
jgi:hypothetical protein